MPVIPAAEAPTFRLPDAPWTVFTGLASPSRGARETSVWRVALGPGTPPSTHSLDHEEVIVALTGQAVAQLGGDEYSVGPGDAIIVPAGSSGNRTFWPTRPRCVSRIVCPVWYARST